TARTCAIRVLSSTKAPAETSQIRPASGWPRSRRDSHVIGAGVGADAHAPRSADASAAAAIRTRHAVPTVIGRHPLARGVALKSRSAQRANICNEPGPGTTSLTWPSASCYPHGWDCGFMGETTTGTLLCG